MSWLDTLRGFFKPKAPIYDGRNDNGYQPSADPSPIPPPPAPKPPAPRLEDTVATPAAASPAWYSLCEPLTKASESCVLVAYPDPASGADPWTIGYGATGSGITKGTIWSQSRADARLTADLMRFASAVDSLVKVPLSPPQKAALVDFTFNVGSGNLESSTLLRLLNNGSYDSAANQFSVWNLADGKVMPGLVKRRARERSLFLTGTWS